jgi:hypothetical protein
MSLKTPILFLIFNRPDTTQQVFDEIRKAKPKQLFVAADGARPHKNEQDLCERTRQIVSQIDWDCEVKTLFREQNLGCKMAVSSALDWFFSQVEEGIILEDDILPQPYFFDFCTELLEKYRSNPNVMHISGVNLQLGIERGNQQYYFSEYPLIWGWASWKRAWVSYDRDLQDTEQKINETLSKSFVRKGDLKFFQTIMTKVKANLINTWDYQWLYANIRKEGVTIVPQYSLIKNIGFDERATHTLKTPSWIKYIVYRPIKELPIPNEIKIDAEADFFYLSLCRNRPTFALFQIRWRYWASKLN